MNAYVLSHGLDGEQQRLALMSELLDPLEQAHLLRLGVRPGWRCLEVGCGNGSISQWLAAQVAPGGQVIASDLEISYIARLAAPGLEVRQLDILQGPVEQAHYDLVVARALLHHLPNPQVALQRMMAGLKPGGVLLSIEPDMLPAAVAEPESMRKFWEGWFRWAATAGIDYFVGRKIAPLLDSLGLQDVTAEGHTSFANGGSKWARYWLQTVHELRHKLMESGHISEQLFGEFESHLEDPHYWTSVITFVAASGRKAGVDVGTKPP
jgi:SAM-dependent methyltransferase